MSLGSDEAAARRIPGDAAACAAARGGDRRFDDAVERLALALHVGVDEHLLLHVRHHPVRLVRRRVVHHPGGARVHAVQVQLVLARPEEPAAVLSYLKAFIEPRHH